MNNILNEDIVALKIIVSQFSEIFKRHTHNYDITFTSVIKFINSDSTYIIQDQSGIDRKIRCAIPNLTLTIGKSVWVKIPCGRIEDMHICGTK